MILPPIHLIPQFDRLITNLAIIVCIPYIGHWIDKVDRIVSVYAALLLKVVSITLGFSICAFLSSEGDEYFYLYAITLPIICAAANIGFNTYTLCIEKDWLIELANGDSEWLANTNSIMSQIDLACQSFAPAITGLLFSLFSGPIVACILLSTNFMARYVILDIRYKIASDM